MGLNMTVIGFKNNSSLLFWKRLRQFIFVFWLMLIKNLIFIVTTKSIIHMSNIRRNSKYDTSVPHMYAKISNGSKCIVSVEV